MNNTKKEETLTCLHDKLRYIQVNLNAPKSAFNRFGNYNYRRAEDILSALKPFLNELNLTITINTEVTSIASHYYFVCTATIADGSGQTISTKALAREDETQKGMNSSQLSGSCISYAKKYALGNLFAIDDEKEADTNEFQSQTKQQPQPIQQQPQQPIQQQPQPIQQPIQQPQQPQSSIEAEQIMLALQEANAAKDRTELERIWIAYKHLQQNSSFVTPFSAICQKFPKPEPKAPINDGRPSL